MVKGEIYNLSASMGEWWERCQLLKGSLRLLEDGELHICSQLSR